jgi:hypothetical protein
MFRANLWPGPPAPRRRLVNPADCVTLESGSAFPSMRSPIRVVSIMEAAFVTGPAKNLIGFATRARNGGGELPDIELSTITYARGANPPANPFVDAARAEGITGRPAARARPIQPPYNKNVAFLQVAERSADHVRQSARGASNQCCDTHAVAGFQGPERPASQFQGKTAGRVHRV